MSGQYYKIIIIIYFVQYALTHTHTLGKQTHVHTNVNFGKCLNAYVCVCLNVRTKRILLRYFTSLGTIRTCHPVQYCTLDFFLAHYVILFTTICLSYKHIQSFFYKTFYVNLYQTKKGHYHISSIGKVFLFL